MYWCCLGLLVLAATLLEAGPDPVNKVSKKKVSNWKPPEFDMTLPQNITVMEGRDTALPCIVTRLKGRAVSWIRQRDLHIISANQLTFTSDDRFKVAIDNITSSYDLEISPALRNDTGVYECQVNTRPKLSRPVYLTVQVPFAQIGGPRERYIKSGSTLVLSCTGLQHPDANSTVSWRHNGTSVSIAGPRGGVSIHTEKEGQVVTSRLSVVRAIERDAGNYTCHPDSVHPINTTVYIVEDEHHAAMHHEGGCRGAVGNPMLLLMALLSLILLSSSCSLETSSLKLPNARNRLTLHPYTQPLGDR